jgi:HTH-type transcriptional regulator/antitoxin HigA
MSVEAYAEVFPVGEHLADELETRGWTQAEFAEILGRPPQFVSEIIAGKKEITRESAAQIGAAFDMPAEYWLNLQDSYHLWRHHSDDRARDDLRDVRIRARLQQLAPVAVLRQRGYLTETSVTGQARELADLYEMDDIWAKPALAIAARKSNLATELTPTQRAWVACVRAVARTKEIGAYSREGLRALAEGLARDLADPQAFRDLPERFARVGVCLVYVEAFPSSKLDGCSMTIDGVIVIGISGRGKRLDKILFTLLHEAAHICLGHLDELELILDEEPDEQQGKEAEANDLAAHWALPARLPHPPARVTYDWIKALAAQHAVHPIIIIGRLQNQRLLNWRTSLVRGAPTVTDGLRRWN